MTDSAVTESEPATTAESIPAPRPIPNITLAAGQCAFYGSVTWDDKPTSNVTVIADTKPPVVVVPPWESYSTKYKIFTATTDNDGNYVLMVEPNKYYVGSSLPGTDYISYEYTSYIGDIGLFGVPSIEIANEQRILVDLKVIDWAIKLVSPGNEYRGSNATYDTNKPPLFWKEYDWQKYDKEPGYYEVKLKAGSHTILQNTTNNTYYSLTNPLEPGEYSWEVRGFSKSGKWIAGTIDEFYFVVR